MGVIITGAGSGIGLATAHLLHSKGKQISLWDINSETIQKTAKLLDAHHQKVDVTDYDAVTQAIQQTHQALGQIEAVIHCAGIAHVGLFVDLPIEQHQRMVQVNLMGTINISHASISYLKRTNGTLILVASSSSFYGPPDFATYGATKGAIVRFAEAIRIELADDNVHVGVMSPHFVQTPMLDESKKSPMFEGASYTSTAEDIALEIEKMLRLRSNVGIPGMMNKLNYFLSRHLPQIGPMIVRRIWQQGKNKRGRS